MKTIVIPQFYRGPSGQKGLYNRQEVGLARAFSALGCRAVVLYPGGRALNAPRIETPGAKRKNLLYARRRLRRAGIL